MSIYLDGVLQGGGGGGGVVLQVSSTQYSTLTTVTKTTNIDDTVPQRTETGDVFSLSFTPTSATSNLYISVSIPLISPASLVSPVVALYEDGTASAIAASSQTINAGYHSGVEMNIGPIASGSTSARTYVVGVGNNTGATITINGVGGARLYGGVLTSTITITEVGS